MDNIPEFKGWNKIFRLNRECVITEKIDGTNGVIYISEDNQILAGSRTHWLIEKDNFGFNLWVQQNKDDLLRLGPGYHYGEWWGLGIQRGYNLLERRFSLFNPFIIDKPNCCNAVPFLYAGIFNTENINNTLYNLKETGSAAAPGYMNPEGIVIYHTASRQSFKVTLENDSIPKGQTSNE